ncbi:MAG: hypothetical protein R3A10_13735 [Caldilineaceae bacterium]
MSTQPLRPDALVLYKQRPARVTELGAKKITIQDDSNRLQVRPKDVTVLHPGPLRSLNELCAVTGEVESAWELLAGQPVTLAELAELTYGEFTPVTAWAAWELVVDGLYFTGEPDAIQARTADSRAAEVAARAAKAAEEAAWQAFVARVDAGTFAPDDVDYLRDVEELALGQRDQSRTMQALERSESPQEAHALLLRLGYWTPAVNPHPRRFDMPLTDPVLTLPALPDEARRDLTGLRAWLSTTWAARPGRRHQHRRHAAVGACGGCGRAGRFRLSPGPGSASGRQSLPARGHGPCCRRTPLRTSRWVYKTCRLRSPSASTWMRRRAGCRGDCAVVVRVTCA